MAPANAESKPSYQKDEKTLCFHGELLYEAKILDVRKQDPKDKTSPFEYRVHYKGWKNTWDDWVPQDRLRKNTEENRELAVNLRKAATEQHAPRSAKPSTTAKGRKGQASEIGSGRGSEERTSSVPARGTKRARDNDIEKKTMKKPSGVTKPAAAAKIKTAPKKSAGRAKSAQPAKSGSSKGTKKAASRVRSASSKPAESVEQEESAKSNGSSENTESALTTSVSPDASVETATAALPAGTSDSSEPTVPADLESVEPVGLTAAVEPAQPSQSVGSEESHENNKQGSSSASSTTSPVNAAEFVAQNSQVGGSETSADVEETSEAGKAIIEPTQSAETAVSTTTARRSQRAKKTKEDGPSATTNTEAGKAMGPVSAGGRNTRSKKKAEERAAGPKPGLTMYGYFKEKYANDPTEPRKPSVLGEIREQRDKYINYIVDSGKQPTIRQLRDLNMDEIYRIPTAPADEPELFITKDKHRLAPLLGGTHVKELGYINDHLLDVDEDMKPDENGEPTAKRKAMQENTDVPVQVYMPGVPLRRYQDEHVPLAGVATEPTSLDPPGSGGTFDADRFPKVYKQNGKWPPGYEPPTESKKVKHTTRSSNKRKAEEIDEQEEQRPSKRGRPIPAPTGLPTIMEDEELALVDGADFPMQSVEEGNDMAKKRKTSKPEAPVASVRRSARNRSAQPSQPAGEATEPAGRKKSVQPSSEPAVEPRRSGRKRSASVLEETKRPSKTVKSIADTVTVAASSRKRPASEVDEPAEPPQKRAKTEQPADGVTAASAPSKGRKKTPAPSKPKKSGGGAKPKIQRMSKSCHWCREKHIGCQPGHENPGEVFVKGVTTGPTWRPGCGPKACKESGHTHGDEIATQGQSTVPSINVPEATATNAHGSRSASPAQDFEDAQTEQQDEDAGEAASAHVGGLQSIRPSSTSGVSPFPAASSHAASHPQLDGTSDTPPPSASDEEADAAPIPFLGGTTTATTTTPIVTPQLSPALDVESSPEYEGSEPLQSDHASEDKQPDPDALQAADILTSLGSTATTKRRRSEDDSLSINTQDSQYAEERPSKRRRVASVGTSPDRSRSNDAMEAEPNGSTSLHQGPPSQNLSAPDGDPSKINKPRWLSRITAYRQISGRKLPPASKLDPKVKKYPPRSAIACLNKVANKPELLDKPGSESGEEPPQEPVRETTANSGPGPKSTTSKKPETFLEAANHAPIPQEDAFTQRPSIRFAIPDNLKNLLVDDWENITKTGLLVPLPSKAPANFIIDSYFQEEKQHRSLGPECEILEEFCMGMKVYFERALGKILLYRAERPQLSEVRKWWESGTNKDWEGKGVGDCYGGEHLARLLVNMPELIAQTNMDAQSVQRLKEELTKFTVWLSRNSEKLFVAKYEKPESAVA
ncbi:Esa1p-associated factor [Knufia fluminis]|uniref:Chromatin modification-related protein EAF3 n=1 Tax=Knufia fluminis TaxID=191047 RepID=A0AAN8I7W5_9EURO|nr:Esa1p-associated factor [Knufia fluminis]